MMIFPFHKNGIKDSIAMKRFKIKKLRPCDEASEIFL